jgi:signal transduction histidine kinase
MELASSEALSKEEFIDISKNVKLNLEYVREDMDNLLSWARTQLKGFDPSPIELDLKQAVDEKVKLLSETARSKAITLQNDIDAGTIVFIDKDNLDIILRNLIGNAIKFSLPAGTVQISAAQHGDFTSVSITDTGTGMTQDEVEKLFRPESHFSKPGTKKEKGLGIGLLLVKEFVEKNNGSISVTSKEGEGTTFTFTVRTISVSAIASKKKWLKPFNH